MARYNNTLLQVFAKSPVLGTVKTRLQPDYSAEFSQRCYCALVDYVLNQWQKSAVCPIQLCLAGDEKIFAEYLPQWKNLNREQQVGNDLGERLKSACEKNLGKKTYYAVLMVGTDCPFIDKQYLTNACEALLKYDVVIGGAEDGGYVLLGIKQISATLFNNIDWGTEYVYEQTLVAIKQMGLSFFELPALADIDRPSDIEKLKSLPYFKSLF